jgi:uncharacterized membrane protein YeaQ/YmgE (transglycosylase-associated protein family)
MITLENVFTWIICGAVAGTCFRLAIQERQFISLPITIGVGIVGAMLGQVIYSLIPVASSSTATFHYWGGWIVSTLGALFLVWIYPYVAPRSWQN